MSKSSIEWTEHTWNPVSGCTRVSMGCDNCYAATLTKRLAAMGQEKYQGLVNPGKGHFNGVVKLHEDALEIPLKRWMPTTYFVNSMSDLFHPSVPFSFVDKVFAVMARAHWHTFQILTKRPERMAEYLGARIDGGSTEARVAWESTQMVENPSDHPELGDAWTWPLPNVWLGTSIEDQAAADERIPDLAKVTAIVRFLSCEPILGPIEIGTWFWSMMSDDRDCAIGWVIVGGESGPNARPMELEWAEALVSQCLAADVPVFVKQLGTVAGGKAHHDIDSFPLSLRFRQMPAIRRLPARDQFKRPKETVQTKLFR